MRIAPIAAALMLAAPLVLSAQKPSSSTRRVYSSNGALATTAPETVFVKGTVTGIVPTGTHYVITGSKSSFHVDTIYTGLGRTTAASANEKDMSSMPMNEEGKSDLEKTGDKAGKDVSNATKKAGKDISNEAKRTPKNVSKTAKKVGHGAKEAASDVKKAVTGKP